MLQQAGNVSSYPLPLRLTGTITNFSFHSQDTVMDSFLKHFAKIYSAHSDNISEMEEKNTAILGSSMDGDDDNVKKSEHRMDFQLTKDVHHVYFDVLFRAVQKKNVFDYELGAEIEIANTSATESTCWNNPLPNTFIPSLKTFSLPYARLVVIDVPCNIAPFHGLFPDSESEGNDNNNSNTICQQDESGFHRLDPIKIASKQDPKWGTWISLNSYLFPGLTSEQTLPISKPRFFIRPCYEQLIEQLFHTPEKNLAVLSCETQSKQFPSSNALCFLMFFWMVEVEWTGCIYVGDLFGTNQFKNWLFMRNELYEIINKIKEEGSSFAGSTTLSQQSTEKYLNTLDKKSLFSASRMLSMKKLSLDKALSRFSRTVCKPYVFVDELSTIAHLRSAMKMAEEFGSPKIIVMLKNSKETLTIDKSAVQEVKREQLSNEALAQMLRVQKSEEIEFFRKEFKFVSLPVLDIAAEERPTLLDKSTCKLP